MKLKLRNVLLNELDKREISQAELARQVGCSKANITNFFKSGRTIKFEIVLDIVRFLLPEQEHELMSLYCEEIKDPKHLKIALEYCSTHRLYGYFDVVLGKTKKCQNNKINEWVDVYEYQYKCQNDREIRKTPSYLDKLRKTKVTDENLVVFLKIMESYHYYYIQEFNIAKQMIVEALELSKDISNKYLKRSYIGRIEQVNSYVELKVNNKPHVCRESAIKIKEANIGYSFTAFAEYLIGLSYLFTDFNRSLNHFKESIAIYKKENHKDAIDEVEKKIDLLYFTWGKQTKEESNVYNLTLSNNFSKAKQFLTKTFEDEEPLKYFFEGLLNNDKDSLYQSMIKYLKSGDSFLCYLPKKKLIDLGESSIILNELHNINA